MDVVIDGGDTEREVSPGDDGSNLRRVIQNADSRGASSTLRTSGCFPTEPPSDSSRISVP